VRPFSRFSRRGPPQTSHQEINQAADDRIFILTLGLLKGKDPLFAQIKIVILSEAKDLLFAATIDSLKFHHRTTAPLTSFLAPVKDHTVEARFGRKQPFLETGPDSILQPLPFFDRNQNGDLNSAARYHLRTLQNGRVHQFSETRLRVFHPPRSQASPPCHYSIIMTSRIASDALLRSVLKGIVWKRRFAALWPVSRL
jgi:hypothetical protein